MPDKEYGRFFYNLDIGTVPKRVSSFIDKCRDFAIKHSSQVFILNSILGMKESSYDYDKGFVVVFPKCKLLFLNYGEVKHPKFDEFIDDFIEDIGYQSKKYSYTKLVDRPRIWRNRFVETSELDDECSIEEIVADIGLTDKQLQRDVDFIVSLVTGSINDVSKKEKEYSENLLAQIKDRIILFDGEQSRFIYDRLPDRLVTVQGMAGTGKTELLLHKLRELYVSEPDCTIAFTCYNKVLANDLRTRRVPGFFNFMKVEEQIKWNERLFVMPSWGSQSVANSGLYSFICNKYKIPFLPFGNGRTFTYVIKEALAHLDSMKDLQPCFDYILIDEKQDFDDKFLELCQKICRRQVIAVGDIFQNIFDLDKKDNIAANFLLNTCYRTDPKTLMFAHAAGMGLYEPKRITWLKDEGWKACGYRLERVGRNITLSREPIRRFEDLNDAGIENIVLKTAPLESFEKVIMETIREIKTKFEDVTPDDIGIVFLESQTKNYDMITRLQTLLFNEFGWDTALGYESKARIADRMFISNRNNVKGLEFPFVICMARNSIGSHISTRNSIYMMLTRSFISSYLIINEQDGLKDTFSKAIKDIIKHEQMRIIEPKPDEIMDADKLNNLKLTQSKSQNEIMEMILDKHDDLTKLEKRKIKEITLATVGKSTNHEKIKMLIDNHVIIHREVLAYEDV